MQEVRAGDAMKQGKRSLAGYPIQRKQTQRSEKLARSCLHVLLRGRNELPSANPEQRKMLSMETIVMKGKPGSSSIEMKANGDGCHRVADLHHLLLGMHKANSRP